MSTATTPNLAGLKAAGASLPPAERAELVQHLLESLPRDSPPAPGAAVPRPAPPQSAEARDAVCLAGEAIFRRLCDEVLRVGDHGKYVAIDTDTGDYELGGSFTEATDGLRRRRPDARVWGGRAGYESIARFGMRSLAWRRVNT